jgi:hypothetical protein
MQRMIISLAAAALVAAAMPSPANADCHGCGVGAGIAAGILGGAIVGSAIANSQPRYVEPAPVYGPPPPPAYAEPPEYVDGPVCHMERTQYWDGYGYRMRRIQVCD